MAISVARKLCLTAALLGAETRKELAAEFRRVNAATQFDLQRAHKWLQSRAQPRGRRVYEDWALLLDIDRSADWIADCEIDEFVDRICSRHQVGLVPLLRRADAFAGRGRNEDPHGREINLAGTYVCYSHAWSPYFRGHLIRGTLTISADAGAQRLSGTYAETLPVGRLQFTGAVVSAEREVHIQLRGDFGPAQILFWLFEPTPPVSVLGGLMCGTSFMSAMPDLSISRVVMIKLSAPNETLATDNAYLPIGTSVASDLLRLGVATDGGSSLDLALAGFLGAAGHTGFDQVRVDTYRVVVEQFDRLWLTRYQREDDRTGSAVGAA